MKLGSHSYVWVMRLRTSQNNGHGGRWFPRRGPVICSSLLLKALEGVVKRYNDLDPKYEHAVARAPVSIADLLTRYRELFHDLTQTSYPGDE